MVGTDGVVQHEAATFDYAVRRVEEGRSVSMAHRGLGGSVFGGRGGYISIGASRRTFLGGGEW